MSDLPYGAQPFPDQPEDRGGAVTPAEAPSTIRYAVWGMFAGAALSAIGVVASLFTTDQIRAAAEESMAAQPDVTQGMIDTAVTISLVLAIGVGLIGVALWVWMAFANRAGKSWARIVATVLGALNILSTPFTLSQDSATTLSTTMGLLQLVLGIAILVLLWLPASTAYYKARSNRSLA